MVTRTNRGGPARGAAPSPQDDGTAELAPLWTVQDVAGYLRVPVHTLYAWRAQGTGPRARKVGKYLRYRPADVVAWFEEGAA